MIWCSRHPRGRSCGWPTSVVATSTARRRRLVSRVSTRTSCGTQPPRWPAAAGATVKSVQRMLGHASATLTLDRYGHLLADELDDVAARLDDAMRENDVVPMWSRTDPTLFGDESQEA